MAERILSVMIIVLSGVLLSSSGLNFVVDLNAHLLEEMRLYVGGSLIFLSLLLAGSNLILTRHPFYEYWMLVMVGSLIGISYVN